MFKNVQAMRGVAASIVLLIHVLSTKDPLSGVMEWLKYKWYLVGPAGVDIFFVISGFVVTLAAARAARDSLVGGAKFGAARLLRIYPVYWAVLILAWPLAETLVLAPPMPPTSPAEIVFALTTNNPKVMLAWSLYYELFFYAVLTVVVLLAGRRFFVALAVAGVLQLALIVVGDTALSQLSSSIVASPLILEFMGGAVIAYLSHRKALRFGWPLLAIGCVGFCVGVVMHARQPVLWAAWPRTWCFGPPSMLMIYGLVAIESSRSWVLPKWIQRLGDASYSLYIWHQFVFGVCLYVSGKLGLLTRVPETVLLPVWAAIAFGWGLLSYRLIEAPTVAFTKRLLGRWPKPLERGSGAPQAL